jgi:hypothetical protein
MKPSNRILFAMAATAAAVMGVGGLPPASADQDVQIGPGPATANLNFQVIIPAVTRLRIGDPNPGTVNTILFDLSAGTPLSGDGTPVGAGNGGSGGYPNIATTAVEVELLTTAGNLSVSQDPTAPTLVGTLVATNTIPWTEIGITDTGVGFTHSQNGGTLTDGPTNIFTGGPGLFNGLWTFTYINNATYAADTYNGTVQYTVTNP